MTSTVDVVRSTLERCERISAEAEELMPRLRPIFAGMPASLQSLSVDDRTAAVAYLKRYEQLQDLLARLARAVAEWEGLDARAMTARDVGDMLEKVSVVASAEDWMRASRLRNRLTHEYPIEEAEQVLRLAETARVLPALQQWLRSLVTHLSKRGFPL